MNGLLILGAGIYELIHPPEVQVVLVDLHASIWWGGLLTALGAGYAIYFAPGKERG